MRIDGMPAVVLTSYSQSKCYLPFDCRPRALVLHLLLLLLFLPTAHSLTYFVGTSSNQMGPSMGQEEPFLSKEDKQTIVLFCRAALSNPHAREKFKDPVELRRICGTLIQEFKRQRDFEKRKRFVF